jgi:uncharacterized membrane protein YeaQ/YmgE (transglycosylase-associated protein family)
MAVLTWILLGLIAGFIASKIVNRHGSGLMLDIVLGIVGALLGGWLFTVLGSHGVSGLNFHSFLVSVAGAVLILLAFHTIRRTQ